MPKSKERTRSSSSDLQDMIIVGISASAGGLEAIRELLENIPEQSGMAFVIVQHLAESQASLLTEILSRYTKIPVQKVKSGLKIEPDHIYVIPPGVTIVVSDGVLDLKPRGTVRKPIDEFFESLAVEKKSKAIGIILSGTGTDGTEGLKVIKAEGGIIFAQDPKTAGYQDMPQSAISPESVHFILPPKQIATELVRVSKHPELVRQKINEEPAIEGVGALQKIFSMLHKNARVDFTHYKKSTVLRRITRRILLKKVNTIEEYEKYLRSHPEELKALFDDLLIGVTEFFREPKTFDLLNETVFPIVFEKRTEAQPFRVWVPGCSTGEEVYSFAIVLQEFIDTQNIAVPIQIFGTDVSEKNIEKARKAIYPKSIETQITQERLRKFFVTSNGNYQVAKRIRDLCIFAVQDITRDPPFSGLDIIMCRNVMIYFDTILQEKIIPTLHYGLKPIGYLILGESETIGKFVEFFEPVAKKAPIFMKKEVYGKIEVPIGKFELSIAEKKESRAPKEAEPSNLIASAADNILMAEFVPATFVINNSMDVVVTRGQVQPYITMEPGKPSFSVAKMIKRELRPVIQSSVYRARREQKEIQDIVRFKQDGSETAVKIQVKPITIPKVEGLFFFVALNRVKTNALPSETAMSIGEAESAKDQQIGELGEALESIKQTLQSTVEQQESTNEELRSALEEVQSTNEELQSTNEELETAKEELQSTNEELNTLNSELKERNQSLTQLSDDLVNLLDNVDAAVIIVDNDLRIRRFTSPAQEFFRLIPSDVGRKITDIRLNIPVDDLENALCSVIKRLQTTRREIKSGSNWYQMRMRPYITEEKKIDGVVLTVIDISSLKKTEEAVRKSEEQFRKAIEDAPIPVIMQAEDGEVLQISHSWTELTGYTISQIRSFDEWIAKAVYGEGADKVRDHLLESFKGNKRVVDAEFRIRTVKGEERFWSFSASSPGTLRDGRRFVVGMAVDITERTKAEEQLKASSASYARNLIEVSPDPLVTISAEGKITDVNNATEKATGYTREELIDSDFSSYFTEPEKAAAGYKHVFTEGFVKDYPLAIRHKSGNVTDVLYNASVYRDEAGQVQGVFAAARDITDRKKLEKQLQDSERLAAIGATAGMVGHDIRNPLQAISGAVYLLKSDLALMPEGEEKESMKKILEVIEENVEYVNKIVQDLQDFARPINPVAREVDIYKVLCEDVLSKNGIPENIGPTCRVEKDTKKLVTDPDLLKRILCNLVNNAIQAMPEGGKLDVYAYQEAGNTVFVIQDTGVGIPETIRPKLFTPLFTTKPKGQGFGLAVAKRMADALGGILTYETKVGKGTKFILRLPPLKK